MVTVMSRATRAAGTGGVLFYRRPTIDPVDFSWTPEQVELRARARKVAEEAVARYGRHNDSWINGYSKEFATELGGPRLDRHDLADRVRRRRPAADRAADRRPRR